MEQNCNGCGHWSAFGNSQLCHVPRGGHRCPDTVDLEAVTLDNDPLRIWLDMHGIHAGNLRDFALTALKQWPHSAPKMVNLSSVICPPRGVLRGGAGPKEHHVAMTVVGPSALPSSWP